MGTRETLAQQLRAQYNTGRGGSGSWDDAGFDRAAELADLLIKAGVTDLGELSFADRMATGISAPLSELIAKGAYQETVTDGYGNTNSQWYYKDGTPIQLFGGEDGGEVYGADQDARAAGRQLKIGDKSVGYLGDYNNDGSYGNKAQDTLRGIGDEALLGWSARGKGNTSYRVITDPNTGKLVITPGWNSSSDADDFQKAAKFYAATAAAGYGITSLANAGLLGGGAAGGGVNLGAGGGATAADFGMMVGPGGVPTYGGIGAAEAAGAAAASGGAGVGSGLLQLGTLPTLSEPLAALGPTGNLMSTAPLFMEAMPALGATAAGTVLPALGAGGLLSGIDPTLLQLGGAALGAASSQDQEQTTTTKNEPWGPAQDWIKSNIASGQALQQKYTDQPFSPGQQTAYGNLYGLLNSFNTEMLPGLLGNANAMSQGYDRYAPKETRSKPKFGAVGSTWAPGLLKFGG